MNRLPVVLLALALAACTESPTDADLPLEEASELRVRTVQHAASDVDEIFVVVEDMPVLLGGGLAGLQQRIAYPTAGCPTSIQGRVFIQFVVNKEGDVQDAKVVRGIAEGCDREALRAVQDLRFEPGLQRGERVNVRMSLPVTFKAD